MRTAPPPPAPLRRPPVAPALLAWAWLAAALALAALAVESARAAPQGAAPSAHPAHPASMPARAADTGPRRIVALLPSLTETVCALQACERLVGTDRHSNWPAAVRDLPKVGSLDDFQLERIVALKPDLVLAGGESRGLERLTALGLPLVVLRTETHADVRRTLERVAALLGRPEAGAAAWRAIESRLDAAAREVPASMRGQRVYFEVDAGPYAAGAASFIGETLARLGLANIVPREDGPFPKLNPEWVLRQRPDIVFAGERTLAEMPQRPGWDGLEPLRAGRQCGYAAADFDVLVRPGPRLGEAAALMAACLRRLAGTEAR